MIDLRRKLTDIIRAQYSALATTQWLSIRLQLFGVSILSSVVIAALLQRQFGFIDPGKTGLLVSFKSTNISSCLDCNLK